MTLTDSMTSTISQVAQMMNSISDYSWYAPVPVVLCKYVAGDDLSLSPQFSTILSNHTANAFSADIDQAPQEISYKFTLSVPTTLDHVDHESLEGGVCIQKGSRYTAESMSVSAALQKASIDPSHERLYTSRVVPNQFGTVTTLFPLFTGSCYIVLMHQIAPQTCSASPVLMGRSIGFNFTEAASESFGWHLAQVVPGMFAFYSGDVVYGSVDRTDLLDLTQVETDINHFGIGYMPTDICIDDHVDILDTPQLENNIANFIFTQRPQLFIH